jgi:hypothetical protein
MLVAIGILTWAAALFLVPAPLAARIFLAAPLVLAPRLLRAAPAAELSFIGGIDRLAGVPAFVAALPLLVAFTVPPGGLAALCCAPWLTLTSLCGLAGLDHIRRNVPEILFPRRALEIVMDGALGALAVGGIFAMLDRSAIRPLGLAPEIVLLTAVHFHALGFALVTVVAALGRAGSRLAVAAGYIVLVGVGITAAGFTSGLGIVNWAGSVAVGIGGMAVAVTFVAAGTRSARGSTPSGVRRASLLVAGAALLCGVPLGVAWATAPILGVAFIDLETMVRTHGTLNGVGVLLATLAWPLGETR